jgi:hypothetical protein
VQLTDTETEGRRYPKGGWASAVTKLMLVAWESDALWIDNWLLVWPLWYLVAKSWKSAQSQQPDSSLPLDQVTYTEAS